MKLLAPLGLALSLIASAAFAAQPVTIVDPANGNSAVVTSGNVHVHCDTSCTGGGGGGAITAASGSYASGALSAGSIAAGAYVSGSILSGALADGAEVTVGTKADAANCATTNTLIACTRQLHNDLTAALPAGTNYIGGAQPLGQSTGGISVSSKQVANNTTSVAIDASAGTLYGVTVFNNSATIAYLKLYNTAQGSVTCGSGTPVQRIMIPASTSGAGAVIPFPVGIAYGTAITSCVTTGYADADTTAPAASAYMIEFYYK